MKILFLTPWYPDDKIPQHGVFIRDQASALSNKHTVTVLSSKVDYTSFKLFSWTLKESNFGSLKEHRLVIHRSLPFLNQINYLFISVWVAYKISRGFRPDIIHGNIAYPGGIWSYCLSQLLSKPFLVSDHTSRFRDNFRSSFHRILTIFSLRRAAYVVAVSTWASENIERVIKRKVMIVPNLIHVEDYSIASVPDSTVQIGFLGGLNSEIHRKGLDVLIKALEHVRKDFVLHIGGQGKYLEYYKELARTAGIFHKCRFHGFVDHVPDFMKNLHFFISSSRVEAFGMVIAEAMACGLPVIATDSGGPADFVDTECGRLIPPGNASALREAIEWMIAQYPTFDKNLIRKKAVENYSPAAFLQRIERLYNGLART